jgi:hypothetical protein
MAWRKNNQNLKFKKMKKLSLLSLIIFLISYSSFGQTRMLMNTDGIGINPATATEATQAKLWVTGAGPVQNVFGFYETLSERMGIKAVATPTSGVKTSAIVGISDFKIGTPTNQTGQTTGVLGFSASQTTAYGVQGISDAQGSGSLSVGVRGYASNVSDNTTSYGGIFSSYRQGSSVSSGYGIYASTYQSAVGSGNSYGGYFLSDGSGISSKTGVFSKVNHYYQGANAVGAYGVQSEILGNYTSEVVGFQSTITSSGTNGTYGGRFNVLGTGVGPQTGLLVNVKSTNAVGAGSVPSERIGIYSDVEGSVSNYTYGVFARSKILVDPVGSTGLHSYGGYFIATGVSSSQWGIYATSDAPVGPYTNRYAGVFSGNVQVTGSLSKSSGTFKIDHPQDPANKYLYHSFVESPDMKNIYDGTIITNAQGEATVELPAYFESLNKDFRYQLTPIGQFAQVIVLDEISNNFFKIKSSVPNVKVSWQVTGIRKDAYAEANRVVVEVDKQGEEKGTYIHPELFGKDKTKGVNYQHEKAALKASEKAN